MHRLDTDGSPEHIPFLDLSGNDPSEAFTLALVTACGTDGPVYAYNATFENRVMRALANRFPEHAPALHAIIERVVDLLPIARKRYYHPSQHGSWSIKAVLPALCPDRSLL